MTKTRDLWAKVAGERLLEIGKLKEWLDRMRRERNEALAEVTVARATGGEPASGEITRLKAELARAVEERDAAHRACDRMDKAFNESQDKCTRAARMIASRDKEIETLSSELLRCVSQRDTAIAERDEIRAGQDSIVAELENLHEYVAEQVRVLTRRNAGEPSKVERLTAERDRAESCLGRSTAERNEAFAERDKARSERDSAIAVRDLAISERAAMSLAFQHHIEMMEQEENDEEFDDITDEELDACDVAKDDEGDPDSDIGPVLSDRIDRIGNALSNLGSSVDRQAGRVDALTESVLGLTARFEGHEEGEDRRLAEAVTRTKHLLECVESLFAKFDHPKLAALLRPEGLTR